MSNTITWYNFDGVQVESNSVCGPTRAYRDPLTSVMMNKAPADVTRRDVETELMQKGAFEDGYED